MTTDDFAGGAAAPADTPAVDAPKPISVGDEVNAVETQRQAAEKTEADRIEAEKAAKAKPVEKVDDKPVKKPTAKEALQKAKAAVEAKEAKPRDETTGKFTAKEGEANPAAKPVEKPAAVEAEKTEAEAKPTEQPKPKVPHDDAPKRLDDAAKKEWANAPEPVRGAVHRTITELEQGITEHQQRWEKLKPYDDLAKQQGTSIHEAMDRYIAFERSLNENLSQGLDGVIRDVTGGKMGLRDVAARVMGQKPEEAQSQNDATIADLRKELGSLKQQLQGIGGTIQQQAETKTADEITAFWKENSDAEDLAGEMVPHLKAGKTIREAYDLAKTHVEELAAKFGFTRSPAPAQTRTDVIPKPAEAQTLDKGSKSISGAPGAGALPATRKTSPSIRDAVKRAMQQAT